MPNIFFISALQGDTELPIGEFRQLHSQISNWLSDAEARLKGPATGLGQGSLPGMVTTKF